MYSLLSFQDYKNFTIFAYKCKQRTNKISTSPGIFQFFSYYIHLENVQKLKTILYKELKKEKKYEKMLEIRSRLIKQCQRIVWLVETRSRSLKLF